MNVKVKIVCILRWNYFLIEFEIKKEFSFWKWNLYFIWKGKHKLKLEIVFLKFKSRGGETNDKSFSVIQKTKHDPWLSNQSLKNRFRNYIITIFQRWIWDPKTPGIELIVVLHRSPVGIYLLKVHNRNTRTWCELCSKLTIKTPERLNEVILVSLLLTSKIFYTLFYSVLLLILNK